LLGFLLYPVLSPLRTDPGDCNLLVPRSHDHKSHACAQLKLNKMHGISIHLVGCKPLLCEEVVCQVAQILIFCAYRGTTKFMAAKLPPSLARLEPRSLSKRTIRCSSLRQSNRRGTREPAFNEDGRLYQEPLAPTARDQRRHGLMKSARAATAGGAALTIEPPSRRNLKGRGVRGRGGGAGPGPAARACALCARAAVPRKARRADADSPPARPSPARARCSQGPAHLARGGGCPSLRRSPWSMVRSVDHAAWPGRLCF
jgi:hypothetical protein